MAFKIRWTPEAEESFDKIIDYLENNWTETEVQNFVRNANSVIQHIAKNPLMFKASAKINTRIGFITKHNSLFYRINQVDKLIILLSFWDNRRDPKKSTLYGVI